MKCEHDILFFTSGKYSCFVLIFEKVLAIWHICTQQQTALSQSDPICPVSQSQSPVHILYIVRYGQAFAVCVLTRKAHPGTGTGTGTGSSETQYFLVKRPSAGSPTSKNKQKPKSGQLLAGQWEFPNTELELESESDSARAINTKIRSLLKQLGVPPAKQRPRVVVAKPVQHVFSHIV